MKAAAATTLGRWASCSGRMCPRHPAHALVADMDARVSIGSMLERFAVPILLYYLLGLEHGQWRGKIWTQ